MNGLWEILIQIIGASEDNPLFVTLKQKLDPPEVLTSGKRSRHLEFMQSGLSISSSDNVFDSVFDSVFIHYGSAAVRSGTRKPYTGNLPNDVEFGDGPQAVTAKLNQSPTRVHRIQGRTPDEPKDLWLSFEFGSVEVTFTFNGSDDALRSVSLKSPTDTIIKKNVWHDEVDNPDFFTNFSKTSLRAIQCARDETKLMKQNFIGSEQLLLGMLVSGENIVSQALTTYDITPQDVRQEIIEIIGERNTGEKDLQFTPLAKKILYTASKRSMQDDNNVVDVHYIFFAMLKDADGVGPRILENLKVSWSDLEKMVLALSKSEHHI